MKKTLLDSFSRISTNNHQYTVRFWTGEVADVVMIDYPINARQTLARTTRGYTGRYDVKEMPESEVAQNLQDLKATKLGTPAEMLNFVFLVRDVPRSFTHQIVRTRVGAAYVQESTRFIGAKDVYDVLVPNSFDRIEASNSYIKYVNGIMSAIEQYENVLTNKSIPSQDARQLLPHAMLTHLYWSVTLRALMGIYDVRWCCQAEPSSWIPVMKQVKTLIYQYCGKDISDFLTAPIDRNESCGFGASFDRPCEWRQR